MVNYKKQIIAITNWLIIGLIVLLWLKFSLQDNEGAFDADAGLVTMTSSQTSMNRGSVSQYHIFGSAQKLYDIPLSQGQTSLDFVLNGTMSNLDATKGMAYISNVQGVQKRFKVGAKVFNLAILKEIHKSHVVLSHNGKNERLSLLESTQVVHSTRTNKNTNKKSKPAFLKHLNGSEQRSWQQMIDKQKFDPNKISNIVSNINMVTDQSGAIRGLRVGVRRY